MKGRENHCGIRSIITMTKAEKIARFDPSGVGLKNGQFIGLPFSEKEANIVLLPVPWDVTVSFGDGTSTGPQNILACSSQLDLYDEDVPDAWKMGIYMRPLDLYWLSRNNELRREAEKYIDFLEKGGAVENDENYTAILEKINRGCAQLKNWVFGETSKIIEEKKKVGIVGGDHSVPLGYLLALAEKHPDFGILQIDAHQDLRKNYEGFKYSHASIFYNALKIKSITKLIQVGIRDTCEDEVNFSKLNKEKITVWSDQKIKASIFGGINFSTISEQIIKPLPQRVYISFDIDGLSPDLCPNTGTPVPGGLTFFEAIFLINKIVESGREIIGFDLCEVAGSGNYWDGNVGARILYRLCNLMGKSTPGW